MSNHKQQIHDFTELRKKAESRFTNLDLDIPNLPKDAVRKLIYELQTHQVELEIQNEELRRAQESLLESRDQYSDLYDFAPVGYLTVSTKGLILNANLTLATMLGVTRRALIKQPLSSFIHPQDQDIFYKHRQSIFESQQRDTRCLRMLRNNAESSWVELDSIPVEIGDDGELQMRMVVLDIAERKETEQALLFQAIHDDLTGLLGRSEFERLLTETLRSAKTDSTQHAFCYLDLDQFKVINDTCGHAAGDKLLRQLSKLLKETLVEPRLLARLGGDEFGVLIKNRSLEDAKQIADTLRAAVDQFRFKWRGWSFHIGISIGVTPINAGSVSPAQVMSAADSACYIAKDKGGNRVQVFSPGDAQLANRQTEMQWVRRVDQALEEQRMQLWSQAIVPVSTEANARESFELLLRMIDENGEIIAAEDFLPAAERYGLGARVDSWVVDTAFSWLNANPAIFDTNELCFINLSGASLIDENFQEILINQLDQLTIPAQNICFEVTENTTIANISRAISFMEVIQKTGCKFALDDFGSGLSSFAYLKHLPVEYLKIDGTFVTDILDDEVDLALVRSINEIGKVMGKKTVAEWTESEAILNKLREIGVGLCTGAWY